MLEAPRDSSPCSLIESVEPARSGVKVAAIDMVCSFGLQAADVQTALLYYTENKRNIKLTSLILTPRRPSLLVGKVARRSGTTKE